MNFSRLIKSKFKSGGKVVLNGYGATDSCSSILEISSLSWKHQTSRPSMSVENGGLSNT